MREFINVKNVFPQYSAQLETHRHHQGAGNGRAIFQGRDEFPLAQAFERCFIQQAKAAALGNGCIDDFS